MKLYSSASASTFAYIKIIIKLKTIVKIKNVNINGINSSNTLLKILTKMQYYSLYLMNCNILENIPIIIKICIKLSNTCNKPNSFC